MAESGQAGGQGLSTIEALPCWRGEARVRSLSGCLTNENFLVEDDVGRYVARLSEDRSILGIDRRTEIFAQGTAASIGIAPAIVYQAEGVLVSEFIEGKTLEAADVRDVDVLTRLAATLRRLHDAREDVLGELVYFCSFQTLRTYVSNARKLGATIPDGTEDALDDASQLGRSLGAFMPSLCHNDMLAANILDVGGELKLVDWEYGGIGRPLFDLSGVSGNCELGDELEDAFLGAYFDSLDEAMNAKREIQILKTVSLLREALWAVIQTKASELDFDYDEYARKNLEAYRAARAKITASP